MTDQVVKPQLVVYLSDEVKKLLGPNHVALVKEWGKGWKLKPGVRPGKEFAMKAMHDLRLFLNSKSSLILDVSGNLDITNNRLDLKVSLYKGEQNAHR